MCWDHLVLVHLSMDYSRLRGKFLCITTSFATNFKRPLIWYNLISRNKKSVRLACLIHAASVHPELGSNSHWKRQIVPKKHLLFLVYYKGIVIEPYNFGCKLIELWMFCLFNQTYVYNTRFQDSCQDISALKMYLIKTPSI